jgi:Putative beta-barrel porin 2
MFRLTCKKFSHFLKMPPANSKEFGVSPLRFLPLAAAGILVTAMAVAAAPAEPAPAAGEKPPSAYGVSTSQKSRVPVRGEYTPPKAAGPASLTTELSPSELATPLLPEGMEDDLIEPLPPVDAKKRWTLTVEARAIYDDNIFLSAPGREQSDFVFLFTPSISYRRGDTATRHGSYIAANYTASGSLFADHSEENSLDHSFRFDAQKQFGKLALGADGKYQRLSGATVELSDRVDRDEAGARLRARYDLSSKTSVEASGGWSTVRYREGTLEDYDEWVAETYVGYQVTGRTRVAAGGAVGQLDVEGQEGQDYTRALVKVTTEPSGKLTLDAKAGMEWRNTEAGSQDTPVFNVTAEYRPTARTSLSGAVYRDVSASGSLEGENVTRTGGSVRVQQKLGSALTASVEAGYEQLEYDATESGAPESRREDEYFFVRPSLRYERREGRRLELYYSHREDNSTINLYDFEAGQVGLAFACDF